LPVAALHQLWQDGAGMNESEKQFSFTRAASITSGRPRNQIPISSALALDPTHQLVNLKYVFRVTLSRNAGERGQPHVRIRTSLARSSSSVSLACC
jgi:hypothetical protein